MNDAEAKEFEAVAQAALDKSGASLGTAKPVVMVTPAGDQEARVAKLGKYFREYLYTWMAQLTSGVRFTPAVSRELSLALLELAAAALLAPTDQGDKESDEATERRCLEAARAMLDVLERQVVS